MWPWWTSPLRAGNAMRAASWVPVASNRHSSTRVAAAAHEAQGRMARVVVVDPLEAGALDVALVQCRRVAIQAVQVAHQRAHALVQQVVEQVPVEALVVVPLGELRELVAHEEQLLAGVAEHEA